MARNEFASSPRSVGDRFVYRNPKLLRKSSGSISSLLTWSGNEIESFGSSRFAEGETSFRVGTRPMAFNGFRHPSLDNTVSTKRFAALG